MVKASKTGRKHRVGILAEGLSGMYKLMLTTPPSGNVRLELS